MSFPRLPIPALALALGVALVATLLPGSYAAAQGGQREYIVTLAVSGAGRVIDPASRGAFTRLAARAERVEQVTERLTKEHRVDPRQRFSNAFTGFSARMSPAQARALARDAKVASVRPVRPVRLANQTTPAGIARVKAVIGDGPVADVEADVAVIDTGIGPSVGTFSGVPSQMQNVAPQGQPELNIAGGINCSGDGGPGGAWSDTQGHGTHVAGIIGARDNAVGTVGVAPGVRLWSVRVFSGDDGTDATVYCGLSWVIGRNSDGNPNNDIDVINMSIETPRIDLDEDCDTVLANPGADIIQVGVCEVVALGVTVVGAAGNRRDDANYWAPGGYDQVITVGAMTDTDGAGGGGGGNAGCGGYGSQRDDTYATAYSNYGPDVDIVAPGTCVRSAYPSADGSATAVLTGTSMSTPHVTGAVARYIAERGPTTPTRMQRLIRAAGRMDWDARTDPLWSGTADPDPPNRVLDVRALVGGHMLRTWLYHDTFKVSGKDRSRTTRVDIQRGGGYPDEVRLTRSGLPEGASATFDQPRLDGLDPRKLGTNLKFDFRLDGAEGAFDVEVASSGPSIASPSRNLTLIVDRTGPVVSGLGPKLRKASLARNGSMSAYLRWSVNDAVSQVKKAQLQRKIGSASQYKSLPLGGLNSTKVTLKRGQTNRFRVKATDTMGNTKWSSSVGARLGVRDSTSGMWQMPANGGWKTKLAPAAYGGSFLLAKRASDSLSSSFYGTAVAIAAPVGPGRGTLQLRVDGGSWRSVSLKAGSAKHRKVVWSQRLGKGRHTIEIRAKSGQAAIDALLFVR